MNENSLLGLVVKMSHKSSTFVTLSLQSRGPGIAMDSAHLAGWAQGEGGAERPELLHAAGPGPRGQGLQEHVAIEPGDCSKTPQPFLNPDSAQISLGGVHCV